jgi:hypothetical protein
MLDVLIAAWLETATIRAMALSPADPTPLVLVVNTSVPPPAVWHEVSHRAACRAFPDDNVLTHLLVQVRDADDGHMCCGRAVQDAPIGARHDVAYTSDRRPGSSGDRR